MTEGPLLEKNGQIEVICGPMFSGKTEELIRRMRRAEIARQVTLVFKPAIDDRYDEARVVSHSAQTIPSIAVDTVADMEIHLQGLEEWPDVIGIDESQFFSSQVIELVEDMAERGTRVIVTGLDQDYMGRPFGPVPHLLCIADFVTKQSAVCLVCGNPASKSQRVKSPKSTDAQVVVGAIEAYEARCRGCHVKGIAEPYRHAGEKQPSLFKNGGAQDENRVL